MEKTVYHVVVQGNHNANVFAGDINKEKYLERILRFKEVIGAKIYAFSIFDNHAHFLFRGTEKEISGLMRRVGVSFSHWYRKQYCHEGTLFRGRPAMEVLTSDNEILRVARYIHQEPVKAGLVSTMEAYPWSSYWMYQTDNSPIDRDEITERLRFWGSFEDYMAMSETGLYLEEKPAHFGLTDEEAKRLVRARLHGHPTVELNIMPHAIRNYLLAVMRFTDRISILQLSAVTGVGRGIVQRITPEDRSIALFQGDELLHCGTDGLPREVMDHLSDWCVLMEKQTTFQPCDLLLPYDPALRDWSVPPCEHWTASEETRKQRLESLDGKFSAAHISLFSTEDLAERQKSLRDTMHAYLEQPVFRTLPMTMVYTERFLQEGQVRRGLVGCIDLEKVSVPPNAERSIRFLEEADPALMVAFKCLREKAPMEVPGIVLAVDDDNNRIFHFLSDAKKSMKQVYDVRLMESGGRLHGYSLNREQQEAVMNTLDVYSSPEYFVKRYKSARAPFMFTVLQGENELAGAVMHYEQMKIHIGVEDALMHPARFVLAEIVNFRDPAVHVESQFPVFLGTEVGDVMEAIARWYPDAHSGALHQRVGSLETEIRFSSEDDQGKVILPGRKTRRSRRTHPLTLLTPILKQFEDRVRFVPREKEAAVLAQKEHGVALSWNTPSKDEILEEILTGRTYPAGALCFGSEKERRYLMEGRLIE